MVCRVDLVAEAIGYNHHPHRKCGQYDQQNPILIPHSAE
jgi:hypothetical protein